MRDVPGTSERPLRGARVLITRPEEDGGDLAASIAALGGEAECVPLIRIAPPEDGERLEEARRNLGGADWVALTSRHAARALFEGMTIGPRPKIAVVGASTARALEGIGRRADLVAEGRGGAALAEAMIAAGAGNATVLYPRSDLAADDLARVLESAGARVVSFVAYRTLPPAEAEREALLARLDRANGAVFASPSAARNFVELAGANRAPLESWIAVGIGKTTGAALREAGFAHVAEARRPDDAGLLEALVEAWLGRARSQRNES